MLKGLDVHGGLHEPEVAERRRAALLIGEIVDDFPDVAPQYLLVVRRVIVQKPVVVLECVNLNRSFKKYAFSWLRL